MEGGDVTSIAIAVPRALLGGLPWTLRVGNRWRWLSQEIEPRPGIHRRTFKPKRRDITITRWEVRDGSWRHLAGGPMPGGDVRLSAKHGDSLVLTLILNEE